MSALEPGKAQFLLHDVYLPLLKTEHRTTKSIIEAIPLDKGDYRPDPISRTAMELAWHIGVTEMRFMDALPAGAFDLTPRPRPETVRNSKDLVEWYAENFEQRLETLAKLSNDQLVKVIDFRGLLQSPAVMYLGFLLNHSIHHRGQLSTYLRPMGATVPVIYGESYASGEARKAAQKSA